MATTIPQRAVIREVGLRDGLQSIRTILPTERKKEWIRAAYDAGLRELEVGSFVPARLLPQLADTAEIVDFARTLPSLLFRSSYQTCERRGRHRQWRRLDDCAFVCKPRSQPCEPEKDTRRGSNRSRTHSRRTGCLWFEDHYRGGVGTAFGCTIQGEVNPAEVLRLMEALLDVGADRVCLADTVGYADPLMVMDLFERARAIAGDKLWCGHFHDTRGLGLANVFAALQTGITRFDACLTGIGGCPHAPGASGNVAGEDLAYMLESMGIETGVDISALLALREKISAWLAGEIMHGTLWKAGLPKTFGTTQVTAAA